MIAVAVVVGIVIGVAVVLSRRGGPQEVAQNLVAQEREPQEAPGLQGGRVPALAAESSAASESTKPAPSGAVVRGRVVSSRDGEPIPDGRIAILAPQEAGRPVSVAARSDADGGFRVDSVLSPGSKAQVLVRARGFLPYLRTIVLGESSLSVRMEEGARLQGVVVDHGGSPLAGARVACHVPSNTYGWPINAELLPSGAAATGNFSYSRDDGTFEVSGLSDTQAYSITAQKDGYVWGDGAGGPVQVRAGTSVRIELWRASELTLRLVDSETGNAVADAQAMVSAGAGASTYSYYGPREQASLSPAPLGKGEIRVRVRNNSAGAPASKFVIVKCHVSALGYKSSFVKISIDWGARATQDVPIKRTAPREERAVRFKASLGDEQPFSGELTLYLKRFDDESGEGLASGLVLRFEAGKADRAVDLPVGSYWVDPHASGSACHWWSPAGAAYKLVVDPGGDEEVTSSIRLAGTPVALTVVGPVGREVRGYSLRVGYEDRTGGHLIPAWDVPGVPGYTFGQESLEQVVFVKPAPGFVEVLLPGVGVGRAHFDTSTRGGERLPVRIRLERAKRADRAPRSGGVRIKGG